MTTEVADAPRLEGFEAISTIGSGGFSDVYLYRQSMPRRQVAVKVLKADISDLSNLASEANLMAAIEHQFIVPVYAAPVSGDGRLCLVMKYYAGQDYAQRLKTRAFSVPDVLRIGVQVAGAVEAAHRVGVLHRDIKPANILGDGRRPVLTDFGISAVLGDSESVGYSPPWAPPEAFANGVLDVRSDIYSLAATLYTLLCRRSPFESSTDSNAADVLAARVAEQPVPATGLAEVPPTLERVLRLAMSKRREDRPPTAADFGRQLQRIESELKLQPTPLDFGSSGAEPTSPRPEPETRVAPQIRRRAERDEQDDLAKPEDDRPAGDAESTRSVMLTVAVGLIVLAVGVFAWLRSDSGDAPVTSVPVIDDGGVNDNLGAEVARPPAPPSGVSVEDNGDGTFTFSWAASSEAVRYDVYPGDGDPVQVVATSYTTAERCVEIEVVGASGRVSKGVEKCAS